VLVMGVLVVGLLVQHCVGATATAGHGLLLRVRVV
jgi:hypothetical protein